MAAESKVLDRLTVEYAAKEFPNSFYEKILPNQLYPVRMINYESPACLWVAPIALYKSAKIIHYEMQEWYNDDRYYIPELKPLKLGDLCAFKYDGKWHRGMIVPPYPKPENCTIINIRFVDGGHEYLIDRIDVRPLYESFASVPPSAIKCSINGIIINQLTDKRQHQAKKYFKSLGPYFACRFLDPLGLYPANIQHTNTIELYEFNRVTGPCLEFVEVQGLPDEDLAARSGFLYIRRDGWYSHDPDMLGEKLKISRHQKAAAQAQGGQVKLQGFNRKVYY